MALQIPLIGAGYIGGILLKPIIYRAMAALGIGLITYVGLDLLIDQGEQLVSSKFTGLPADLASTAAYVGIDVYITMILSAHAASLTFKLTTKIIGVR